MKNIILSLFFSTLILSCHSNDFYKIDIKKNFINKGYYLDYAKEYSSQDINNNPTLITSQFMLIYPYYILQLLDNAYSGLSMLVVIEYQDDSNKWYYLSYDVISEFEKYPLLGPEDKEKIKNNGYTEETIMNSVYYSYTNDKYFDTNGNIITEKTLFFDKNVNANNNILFIVLTLKFKGIVLDIDAKHRFIKLR